MNMHKHPPMPTAHPAIHDQAADLPNNLEAEQALLGAILVNNDAFDRVSDFLLPDHFHEPLHRRIYEVSAATIGAGNLVNPVTIKTLLPADDKIGGLTVAQYLARLASDAVSIINARDYGQAILFAAKQRDTGRVGEALQDAMFNAASELGLVASIENQIEALEDIVSVFADTKSQSPGSSYLDSFDKAARNDGVAGVPIALPEISRVLSEPVFEAGNLYGLLSSSGEGKTSLTLQLMFHAIKQGHPVLFLSYDQSAAQCIRQMIAQVHGISISQQRQPNDRLSEREKDTCVSFATWIDRTPTNIIRCQREGVIQLCAYARRFIKRHKKVEKTPLIVVDHIGKVKARDPKLSADRISGEVTVEFKAVADETGSAFLVLNQRNSFGTKRDNPRPIAADLYGGEGARADYDAVLYLYRPERYKAEREKIAATDSDWKKINKVFGSEIEGVAEIGAIKVRFGDPTLTESLKFEARYTRYVSTSRQSAEPRMF